MSLLSTSGKSTLTERAVAFARSSRGRAAGFIGADAEELADSILLENINPQFPTQPRRPKENSIFFAIVRGCLPGNRCSFSR